ncbi:MAG: hypothetical protein WA823_06785 [Candidatus Acidiferrales bacterium]
MRFPSKTIKLWTTVVAALLALAVSTQSVESALPIRLDPNNPHYFQFRGKTIALITSGEHYGAVLNGDFDYHKYLATIESDGLNFTRIFGGEYVEVPGKSFGIQRNDLAPASSAFVAPWARSDTPGYAGGGNKFDLNEWNPEYFRRFHDFLGQAAKRGIAVEITLFSAHYDEAQWNLSALNPSNNVNGLQAIDWKKLHTAENGGLVAYQERYARKLVHEAAGYDNVIFEIQNEPWSDRPVFSGIINPYLFPPNRDRFPNSVDLPDDLAMAWQQRVAEWIADEESKLPNRHLISQDFSNFRYPVRTVIPGVSIVSFHYAYPEAASWNYGLGKVISCDETGFLGRGDDAYRRQAWNFMFSGGGAFDGLDYSFSVGHEDGTDDQPNGPGGGSAEFRRELKVLRKFLESLPLESLHPDGHVVASSPGVVTHAMSSADRVYAIYLDGDGPVDLTLRLPQGHFHADWLSTTTGKIASSEDFQNPDRPKTIRSPGFKIGIALKVVKLD